MDTSISQRQSKSYSRSFIKGLIVVGVALIVLSLAYASALQVIVYAQGGVKGYVVGSKPVAAYACPDTNTTKCPIKLTLQPGTEVLIVDNVVGSAVPGTNDNAWRKIVYKGQTLFVPMRYISINPPNNSAGDVQDISFVQTSHEDNSAGSNNASNPGTTSVASSVLPPASCPGVCFSPPCPTNTICMGGNITIGWSFIACPSSAVVGCFVAVSPRHTCPPGSVPNAPDPNATSFTCTVPLSQVTFYTATDGRINGNAGDRIAIYCRQTGRIEVWSINDSQGHFLVEFNHLAVDAAGRAGFRVNVPGQGVVTIGGDGHGQYWVAITGGPYNATGSGDFAKPFSCYAH